METEDQQQFDFFSSQYNRLLSQELNNYNYYDELDIFLNFCRSHYPQPNNFTRKKGFINLEDLLQEISAYLVVGNITLVSGASGGNYNDTNGEKYIVPFSERKEAFPFLLEPFLEIISPSLTLIEYREMLKQCNMERSEHSKNEYYGNCQDFDVQHIDLNKVFTYLLERDLIISKAQFDHIEENKFDISQNNFPYFKGLI